MNDKNLIVGIDTSDDAAVYKLNDEMATIQTLDFFTPIVDDPYTFGQIAAANSLSDVYAMGGKPIVALNIVCFPNCLNMNILGEILRGGADKVLEAGAVIVGGHTVQDDEPKYGLSVTGIVHPDKVLKNYGSETGDILILTKPIGLGIINTAIKAKIASKEAYEKAVKVMAYLNKYAGEIITDYNITSCTDITGFSLIGHAYEMAEPSKKTFRIFKDAIPFIKEAKEYASMGLIPAGCYENKRYLEGKYLLNNVESWMEDILFDPQTSGGLLISCKEKDYIDILTRLEKLEVESSVIGRVEDFNDAYIVVE
ncbi:Selenide water dikinase [Clostridium perfringens]|nr:Selenide,water dikinase; selenocysteine-containing [Clostridium perfringens]BDC02756.1 selenide, water dikinase [Clostridium perfringens E]MDG6889818.1 Selenide water dikinase [Clostridium perfringens]MDH5065243.1 Selenide water dikinase [Clostridium perfringens]TBX18205.1 selenide, water dikinase SelD [Clostridium perfringens]